MELDGIDGLMEEILAVDPVIRLGSSVIHRSDRAHWTPRRHVIPCVCSNQWKTIISSPIRIYRPRRVPQPPSRQLAEPDQSQSEATLGSATSIFGLLHPVHWGC